MNIYKYFLISVLLMVPISQKASGLPSSSNAIASEELDDLESAAINENVHNTPVASSSSYNGQQVLRMTLGQFTSVMRQLRENPDVEGFEITYVSDLLSPELLEYQECYAKLLETSQKVHDISGKLEEQKSRLQRLVQIAQDKNSSSSLGDANTLLSVVNLSLPLTRKFCNKIDSFLAQDKGAVIDCFKTSPLAEKRAAVARIKNDIAADLALCAGILEQTTRIEGQISRLALEDLSF